VPAAGGGEEWLTDESGGILETRFDERTLQHIASMTGGRYFRSVTGGELRDALDTIVAAERRQVGTNAEVAYRELYVVLLAAATLATAVLVTIS
jgi:Ca-activated chloride channel family protein